jgi:rfaE bifunctional protein nucleotidyltransferase chain/domain
MNKIFTLEDLVREINLNPQRWKPLVFTNGCFDLLHAGHVRYLIAAKSYGKALVVGLNSDRSVEQIKPTPDGLPPRPIIPEGQRAEVLAGLAAVDAVVIFSQTTAIALLEALKPAIYIKGGDYTPETLPEAPIVASYGGKIELIKVEIPSSTSKIIAQILNFSNNRPN